MRSTAVLISAVGFLAVALGANAGTNLVQNPSFETLPGGGLDIACGDGCTYSKSSAQSVPGWSGGGDDVGQFIPGVQVDNYTYFNYVPDGVAVAYTDKGSLYQNLGTLTNGKTYNFGADVGSRNGDGSSGSVGVVELLANGSVVATATGTAAAQGDWSFFSGSYTATPSTAGETLAIELASTSDGGTNVGAAFDSVSVTASGAPEPASWAMMLVGVAGLGGALRVRRRATLTAA